MNIEHFFGQGRTILPDNYCTSLKQKKNPRKTNTFIDKQITCLGLKYFKQVNQVGTTIIDF